MVNDQGRQKRKLNAVLERFFEPCVLYLLLHSPSYGYELKTNLEEKCHCVVDTGNLYRALRKLEKEHYIASQRVKQSKGPARKVYSITTEGEEHLSTWIEELTEHQKIINKLIIHYHKTTVA